MVEFDDSPSAARSTPPLTTVRTPRYEIGVRAAEMLMHWPEDGPTPDSVILTSQLQVRGTTRVAGGRDETFEK